MQICRLAAVLLFAALPAGLWAKDGDRDLPEPVVAPLPVFPADVSEGSVELAFVVSTEGKVDAVEAVKSTDPRLEEAAVSTLRAWIFLPETRNQKPVGSTRLITFECKGGSVAAGRVRGFRKFQMGPEALTQVAPVYPKELVESGNVGKVVINFVIDEKGRIRIPRIQTSTHPAFEGPALAALLKWRFSPATINGKPVPANMQLPMSFTFDDGKGGEAYTIDKRQKRDTPEELKFDTPPKPKLTVFAAHPYDDVIAHRKGSAEVKVLVGTDGKVLASQIVKASKPEFGLALAAALEAWHFEPAKREKKAVFSGLERKQDFEIGDRDSAIDPETLKIVKRLRNGTFEPANPRELDRKLAPTYIAPLVYPTALNEKGVEGSARIEVIIDKKGRAVLPRIVEASEPEFGWAAATAVQRWMFEPPTVGGKPVEIRVQIPFSFAPPVVEDEAGESKS